MGSTQRAAVLDGEDELYDEFGNYTGPGAHPTSHSPHLNMCSPHHSPHTAELGSDVAESGPSEEEIDSLDEERGARAVCGDNGLLNNGEDDDPGEGAVVLHEDKKYYPSAMEVYGEEVETTVQEEDTQPITQPIVAPIRPKDFDIVEKSTPETVYSHTYLQSLMPHAELVRNVAVVGHMQHGKTSLIDKLIEATHDFSASTKSDTKAKEAQGRRYTDSRVDEQKRGLSIKASPISLLLQSPCCKHYLFNIIDVPGHTNFADEVTASLRLADGVLLVVDVIEGVAPTTERLIKHAIGERLHIVLCLNKLDRLMLELKLPPQDAYFKIRQVIAEVNTVIHAASAGAHKRLAPEEGSVIFASAQQDWCFSLESFAEIYAQFYPDVPAAALARRLWGDVWFQPNSHTFLRTQPEGAGVPRSFVQFILEPLYKLISQTLSANEPELRATLADLGIQMNKAE